MSSQPTESQEDGLPICSDWQQKRLDDGSIRHLISYGEGEAYNVVIGTENKGELTFRSLVTGRLIKFNGKIFRHSQLDNEPVISTPCSDSLITVCLLVTMNEQDLDKLLKEIREEV